METKNQKGDGKHKDHNNKIVLPKSYIGQHRRYHSHTDEELNKINLDEDNNNDLENNNYRFNTDRKPKKVSFNKRIQVINIPNYKKENKVLYYGNDEENEEENTNIKKENKCLLCMII